MKKQDKEKYFFETNDITIDKCKELLVYLDELENNNDWLPSPHLIYPYVEFINNINYGDNYSDKLEELSEKLHEHKLGAYEQ